MVVKFPNLANFQIYPANLSGRKAVERVSELEIGREADGAEAVRDAPDFLTEIHHPKCPTNFLIRSGAADRTNL